MARHLAPFSCRQTIAEIVRRRSWGGVLPLGRHASISGSRPIHAPSVSIALSSFQEGQNARHHNQFKLEQALEFVPALCYCGCISRQGRSYCSLLINKQKLYEILRCTLCDAPLVEAFVALS